MTYLTLDFGLNITTPGEYRLEGVLNDCKGSRIELIDQSLRLEKSGNIKRQYQRHRYLEERQMRANADTRI